MRKRIYFILLLQFVIFQGYSLSLDNYVIVQKLNNRHFSVLDTKQEIINTIGNNNFEEKKLNNSCVNYNFNGMEISFLGNKLNSIDLLNNNYYLKSGILIGDRIEKVYENYLAPDYFGKFDDGNLFVDYYARLKTESPWKEPQYTLRIVYLDDIINEILIFYTE